MKFVLVDMMNPAVLELDYSQTEKEAVNSAFEMVKSNLLDDPELAIESDEELEEVVSQFSLEDKIKNIEKYDFKIVRADKITDWLDENAENAVGYNLLFDGVGDLS